MQRLTEPPRSILLLPGLTVALAAPASVLWATLALRLEPFDVGNTPSWMHVTYWMPLLGVLLIVAPNAIAGVLLRVRWAILVSVVSFPVAATFFFYVFQVVIDGLVRSERASIVLETVMLTAGVLIPLCSVGVLIALPKSHAVVKWLLAGCVVLLLGIAALAVYSQLMSIDVETETGVMATMGMVNLGVFYLAPAQGLVAALLAAGTHAVGTLVARRKPASGLPGPE
jgi:hypothetical protein